MAAMHFDEFVKQSALKLADQIENGKAPWDLRGAPSEYPVDALTGKPLEGIAALQLLTKAKSAGFTDNRWLTPTQIAALGGRVKKGLKGVPSVLWNETASGERYQTKIPETYYNVEQCEDFKIRALPPLKPFAHNPPVVFADMCSLLGYTTKNNWRNGNHPAEVNGNNEIVFYSAERYSGLGKNYDFSKEWFSKSLDGIRAITEARIWDLYNPLLASQGDTEKEAEYHLRENLAKVFMQSHIGVKLPARDEKEEAEKINRSIAELIRKNPGALFKAAADASKLVSRTMELSERSYILLDFERQDAFILKAGQCRDYVAGEFVKYGITQFKGLNEKLAQQGFFNPQQELSALLNPSEPNQCCMFRPNGFGHCGFVVLDNEKPRTSLRQEHPLRPETLEALLVAEARGPRMLENTERAILQSELLPESLKDQTQKQAWLKKNFLSSKQILMNSENESVRYAVTTWSDIARRRRTDERSLLSLKDCWCVDFEKNTVEKMSIETAINKGRKFADQWMNQTKNVIVQGISANLQGGREALTRSCETLINSESSADEKFDRNNPFARAAANDGVLSNCDSLFNPASDSDGRGNLLLRDLDHKGFVFCTDPKMLPEISSWGDSALKAQCAQALKCEGMTLEAVLAADKTSDDKKMERFNDYCSAQKTFYSIESERRQKAEAAVIQKLFAKATPEKLDAIKAEITAKICAMTRAAEPERQTPTVTVQKEKTHQRSMER